MGDNIGNSTLLLLMFIVLFLSNTLCISLAKPCHPVDEEALLDVKRRITSKDAPQIRTWSNTKECCTSWFGVVCDPGHGRVVKLSWDWLNVGEDDVDYNEPVDSNEPVSSTLSPFLANLTYLEELDLTFLNLTGPIPPELGKLPNLIILNLMDNQLSGSIPSSIGQLPKLEELDLSFNDFNSTIPKELGDLKLLRKILLADNNLSGSIPEKLLQLKSLQIFDVQINRLTGKIPPHEADLPESGFMDNPGLCDAPLPPCTKFVN